MDALLEQIPQAGNIQLAIQVTANFNYSAQAAQRIAHRFVADEISYMLRAGDPTLVAGERILWRVPIILALPAHGSVGQVGAVDIDVESGRLQLSAEQIDVMRAARRNWETVIRLPVPQRRQVQQADCLAASTAMVLE